LTPDELNLLIDAYVFDRKERLKDAVSVAYYNACFQRSKTMPRLKEILNQLSNEEMSDEELFDAVKSLNSAFDGYS